MLLADDTAALISPGLTTILLVDDDDGLRGVARRVLTRAGYRIVESSNGRDALRQLDEAGHRIDVVLTDMVMPGMPGNDLAHEVRVRHPVVALVLMSGYPQAVLGAEGRLPADAVFVQKPFTRSALLQGIRDALVHPVSP